MTDKKTKRRDALTIFMESVHKPDHANTTIVPNSFVSLRWMNTNLPDWTVRLKYQPWQATESDVGFVQFAWILHIYQTGCGEVILLVALSIPS